MNDENHFFFTSNRGGACSSFASHGDGKLGEVICCVWFIFFSTQLFVPEINPPKEFCPPPQESICLSFSLVRVWVCLSLCVCRKKARQQRREVLHCVENTSCDFCFQILGTVWWCLLRFTLSDLFFRYNSEPSLVSVTKQTPRKPYPTPFFVRFLFPLFPLLQFLSYISIQELHWKHTGCHRSINWSRFKAKTSRSKLFFHCWFHSEI